MVLGLVVGQRMVEELDTIGGLTQSSLPRSERFLLESSDHQEALLNLRANFNSDYRSVMDYVFCEMFPQFRSKCHKFYDDEGPPLRNLVSSDDLEMYDRCILRSLKLAYEVFCSRRKMSWKTIKKIALKEAA